MNKIIVAILASLSIFGGSVYLGNTQTVGSTSKWQFFSGGLIRPISNVDEVALPGITNSYLAVDGTGIIIATTTPSGGGSEATTASNVGAGEGIFKQLTGADLEFKSLVAGTNITLTDNGDDITVDATGGNPFGQWLGATGTPTFANLTVTSSTMDMLTVSSSATIGTLTVGTTTFTGTPSWAGSPVNPSDLVNKEYADGLQAGFLYKAPVVVVAVSNLTLSGEQTIDGVLTSTSRVLVTGQTDAEDNGCYVTAAGAWSRCTDYDQDAEVLQGTAFLVLQGTTYQGTQWALATPNPITVGTTDLMFIQVSATPTITASDGAIKIGNDIQVNYDDSTIGIISGLLAVKDAGINLATKVAGVLGIGNGGTGTSTAPTTGQLLIGKTNNTWGLSTLTAGDNITIDNGDGTIEISSTGGGGSATSTFGATIQLVPIIAAAQTNQQWTAQPVALTEIFGATNARVRVDLTRAEAFRFNARQVTAGFTGATLKAQCSTDGSAWTDMTNSVGTMDIGALGTQPEVTPWASVDAGCKSDVFVRLVGENGNATANPTWRELNLQFRLTLPSVGETATSTISMAVAAAPQTVQTWTNQPAAVTEIFGGTNARFKFDTTSATQYRLMINQSVAGFAGADLNLQCSTDNTTFVAADTGGAGEVDIGTGTGVKTGAWANLSPSCLGSDLFFRLVGKQGDGTADPGFRQIQVQFNTIEQVLGDAGLWEYDNFWGLTGITTTSTQPVWIQGLLFASSTAQLSNTVINGNATTTSLSVTSLANTFLAVDGIGRVIATTTPTGGGGNPFNQWLDTTNTPQFLGLDMNNTPSFATTTIGDVNNFFSFERYTLEPGVDFPVIRFTNTGNPLAENIGGVMSAWSIFGTEADSPTLAFFPEAFDADQTAGIITYSTTSNLFSVNDTEGIGNLGFVVNGSVLTSKVVVASSTTSTPYGLLVHNKNIRNENTQSFGGFDYTTSFETGLIEEIPFFGEQYVANLAISTSTDFGTSPTNTIAIIGESQGGGVAGVGKNFGTAGIINQEPTEIGIGLLGYKPTPTNVAGVYGITFYSTTTGTNIGVQGQASAGLLNYGVYGRASGNTGTKFAGIFEASGTGTNWAGYFGSGNVYIQNRLGIATTTPGGAFNEELTITGDSYLDGRVTSTVSINAPQFCISNDCRTAWPSAGGSSEWQYTFDGNLTPTSTNAGLFVNASSTFNSRLRVNGQSTFNDKVGIGTTTPEAMFVVQDLTGIGSIISSASTTGTAVSQYLIATGTSAIGNLIFSEAADGGTAYGAFIQATSTPGGLANDVFGLLITAGDGTTRSTGIAASAFNVGIGGLLIGDGDDTEGYLGRRLNGSDSFLGDVNGYAAVQGNANAATTTGTNFGLIGSASGGERNFGLAVVNGDAVIKNKLGVGTTTFNNLGEVFSVVGNSLFTGNSLITGNSTTTGLTVLGAGLFDIGSFTVGTVEDGVASTTLPRIEFSVLDVPQLGGFGVQVPVLNAKICSDALGFCPINGLGALNSLFVLEDTSSGDSNPTLSFANFDGSDTGSLEYTTSTDEFSFIDVSLVNFNSPLLIATSSALLVFTETGASNGAIQYFESLQSLSFLNASVFSFSDRIAVSGANSTSTFAGHVAIANGKNLQVSNIFAYSPLNIWSDTITNGNATTTGSMSVGELCFDGENCVSSLSGTGATQLSLPVDLLFASSANASMTSANTIYTYSVTVPKDITVTKIVLNVVSGGGASRNVAVGLYSMDGNTKVLDSGAVSAATNGVKTATLGSPVNVPAGNYILAWTGDNTNLELAAIAVGSRTLAFSNAITVRQGTAANSSASAVLPSTLGVISSSAVNPAVVVLSAE